MQEQMGSVSREMEILRKNQKEMLKIKNTVTVMKNASGDIPAGAVVKNPPPNAGDTGLIPGPGRSHMPQSN